MGRGRKLQKGDEAVTDFNGKGVVRVAITDRRENAQSQSRVMYRVWPPLKGGNNETNTSSTSSRMKSCERVQLFGFSEQLPPMNFGDDHGRQRSDLRRADCQERPGRRSTVAARARFCDAKHEVMP